MARGEMTMLGYSLAEAPQKRRGPQGALDERTFQRVSTTSCPKSVDHEPAQKASTMNPSNMARGEMTTLGYFLGLWVL